MPRQQNQRDNLARGALLLLLLALAPSARASQTSGTIDTTFKYAWGTVAGYVNFAPTNGGLTITDSVITGYAWGANTGWLNFSPTNGGVTNTAAGVLGGYAWDEGGGWVSFTGVTIDSSGKFSGTATGGTVNGASYSLNFDCASCDVRTDWRPASSRTTSAGGNGAISPIIITAATTTVLPNIFPNVSPTSPLFQTAPDAPSRNNPIVKPPIYTPAASLKKATTSSTARAATTTAKKPVASSLFNFIRSIARSIYSGVLAFFRFFMRF